MADLPLVSIVTPSYNQACFLERAMLSVLEQDYPHIEYLVVDGGSSDGSVDIIRKYSGRLAWWVSENDRGQAEGINKGLAHARGSILAWLNSDDYYLPGTIWKAVQAFQEHPECGLVYGNVLSVDADEQPITLQACGDWDLEDLMAFKILGQAAVFFRQALFQQSRGLSPDYHYLLDHQLWLRMGILAPIRHIPQTWAAARYHPGAKNVAHPEKFGGEAYRIVEWMQNDVDYRERYLNQHRRILAGAHRLNAWYLSEGGRYADALLAYGRCLGQSPRTALEDWRRILYSFAGVLHLEAARRWMVSLRKQERSALTGSRKGRQG